MIDYFTPTYIWRGKTCFCFVKEAEKPYTVGGIYVSVEIVDIRRNESKRELIVEVKTQDNICHWILTTELWDKMKGQSQMIKLPSKAHSCRIVDIETL